jgi:threonyl-tRNA synthetase
LGENQTRVVTMDEIVAELKLRATPPDLL